MTMAMAMAIKVGDYFRNRITGIEIQIDRIPLNGDGSATYDVTITKAGFFRTYVNSPYRRVGSSARLGPLYMSDFMVPIRAARGRWPARVSDHNTTFAQSGV